MAVNSEKMKSKTSKEKDYINIHSYPETLFFYPSMIVGIIAFFLQSAYPELSEGLGTFFFAVFAFNFLIVAFDFGLGKTALLAALVVICVLVVILLQNQLGDALNLTFELPAITVSDEFYFYFSILMIVHFALILIISRIDYWTISPTEIYHHRGILGDEKRFGNAQHAHIEKTTPDIFEKMLFLSGDLFIKHDTDPHIYRVSNVFRVNKKEKRIRKILSYVPDKQLDV